MLFTVNVAAVVALALAMRRPLPNPAAPAAHVPIPRDLPPSPGSPNPTVRVNKSYDSSPSYIEGKANDNHSRRNIDDFNVGGMFTSAQHSTPLINNVRRNS
ncbi:hypothetical protein EV421DRAFT_1789934 [Armillaria borealis]|uniref:Uncharacterized protein n=1 Tax=Armillaria borealis TaxID=47425 RepID=A0AA39JVE3_9AGAR|nr:hypothetical protein EV421DRAFT_1789934 [Armillaria borealis]